jgi:hypothetical protein
MATLQKTLRRNRRQFDPSMIPNGIQAYAACSIATTKWVIDFNSAVVALALPVDFLVNGQPPISYVQNSPTRITLTYTAPVATAQTWTIPNRSPNVRTPTGGYVAAATGTF